MNPQAIEAMLQQWSALNKSDRFVFQKLIMMMDGRNIQTGTKTGTMIGTAPTQMISFLGATPAVQQTGGSGSAGGTYGPGTENIINKSYNALRTFGFLS